MTLLPAGLPFEALSGSAGDVVAARNPHGPYLRPRTIPVNTLTPRRSLVKQAFGFCDLAWTLILDDHGRELWNLYAKNVPLTSRTGRRTHPTGRAHFMRMFFLRFHNNLNFSVPPPTTFALVDWTPPRIELQPATRTVRALFGAEPWAFAPDGGVTIGVTEHVPNTINFRKAPMRQCGFILGHVRPPPPYVESFNWPWTGLPDPERCFYDLRLLLPDGRCSTIFHGLALAPT